MKDIQIENGELKIESGDFCIEESQAQHEQLILLAQKGDFRDSPDLGVGVVDYLNAEDFGGLSVQVKREMKKDGIEVRKVKVNNGKLVLEKR